jgi:hypothetical protein
MVIPDSTYAVVKGLRRLIFILPCPVTLSTIFYYIAALARIAALAAAIYDEYHHQYRRWWDLLFFDGCNGAAMDEEAPTRLRVVIPHGAKTSLHTHFKNVNRPLNKILPRGEAYFSGELGNIVKEHGLTKTQVLWQLLNYKRDRFGFQRVAVILTSNSLKQRICKGMSMSMMEFFTQTLSQIYLPGNPFYGSDFNNICAALSAQPPEPCTFVKLLEESLGANCSKLLMGAVEY